jgi:hypothetical protein
VDSFPKTDPALLPASSPAGHVFDTTSQMAVGDVDGDGDADVAVINSGFMVFEPATLFTSTKVDRLTVHLGDGAGNLSPGPWRSVDPTASALLAGDFDGDGRSELAVAVRGDNGGGTHMGRLEVLSSGAGGLAATTYTADFNPFRVLAGDFDGDGIEDLATIGFSGFWVFDPLHLMQPPAGWKQQLTVLSGDGAGGFAAKTAASAIGSSRSPAVADFDGDGLADVATISPEGASHAYVRYRMSAPRSFLKYPGTADGLLLESAVGGAMPSGAPPLDEKSALVGDVVTLRVTAPGSAFDGQPLYGIFGLVPADPVVLTIPGYQNLHFLTFMTSIVALPPLASSQTTVVLPPVTAEFVGRTFHVQAAVLGAAAANQHFASTAVHTFRIE